MWWSVAADVAYNRSRFTWADVFARRVHVHLEKMRAFLVGLPRSRIPYTLQRIQTRSFSAPKVDKSTADAETRRLADQARASQNLWDFMVPERNMGVTHPFFLVLLVLTLSLHYYNNYRDAEEDELLRKRRLARSSSTESSS
jgi:hypothetical protein